jgi:hypothetical protein
VYFYDPRVSVKVKTKRMLPEIANVKRNVPAEIFSRAYFLSRRFCRSSHHFDCVSISNKRYEVFRPINCLFLPERSALSHGAAASVAGTAKTRLETTQRIGPWDHIGFMVAWDGPAHAVCHAYRLMQLQLDIQAAPSLPEGMAVRPAFVSS